jgi:tetratricopeptide (TPR) repeat protein
VICIFAPIVSAETAEEWNNKGIGFAMSGEYEKAIECFEKAIELVPNSASAYNNRGLAYHYLMQYERDNRTGSKLYGCL